MGKWVEEEERGYFYQAANIKKNKNKQENIQENVV